MGGEASRQVCIPGPASPAHPNLSGAVGGGVSGPSGLGRAAVLLPVISAAPTSAHFSPAPARVPSLRPCWVLQEGGSPSSCCESHRPRMEGGSLPPRPALVPGPPTLNSPPSCRKTGKWGFPEAPAPQATWGHPRAGVTDVGIVSSGSCSLSLLRPSGSGPRHPLCNKQ